jgi:signal transduction histidine kinase/CheY-like chemotaxis protein
MSDRPAADPGDDPRALKEEVAALRAKIADMQTELEVLASLSRNVPGVLYVLEPDHRGLPSVVYCSDGVRDILGIAPDEWKARFESAYEHVYPDDRAMVRVLCESAMRASDPAEFEFRVVLADKGVRTVAGRAMSGCQLNGRFARVGYIHDVTEEKLYRSATVKAQAAEQASAAKSEFLSRMSHELRTPLNAILGFSQLLKMPDAEPLSSAQRQKVEVMEQAGQHLLAVINDVLDLSRIESGRLPLSLEPVSTHAAFEHALDLVGNLAADLDVRLLPCHDCDDPTVLADRTRLQQVLVNLLTNGVKYNRPGGTVSVQARQEGERVMLEVRDTGRGMSQEQLAHLFEPFNRLGAEQTGVEGTGIGLVIVKRLLELMDGELEVRSEPGQGTRMRCWLPVGTGPDTAHSPLDELGGLDPEQPHLADGHDDHPRLEVLYAEDNQINIDLVTEILALLPWCRVTVAHNGAEALAAVRRRRPDLLLLDMQLGDMSGFDVVKVLDQDVETTGIPRVALSADAMPDTIRRAQAWGFKAYLTKPLDVAQLMATLEQVAQEVAGRS